MNATPRADRTARIRDLNDSLRRTGQGGRVHATRGVAALAPAVQMAVIRAVQTFDAFTPDNDPWKEHDFGSVDVAGARVFWKIDYYDRQLAAHSPDEADPAVTVRILTIMLASEY